MLWHDDDLTPVIEDLVEQGFSKNSAMKRAILYSNKAKKTLRRLLIANFINIDEHRRLPLFKAVMKKAKDLMNDGFDLQVSRD